MLRSILRRMAAGTVVAGMMLAVTASDAHAGWNWYNANAGSYGSYGSYGGSRGSWGSHGSYGSHGGRRHYRVRHHRVFHSSHGSHGSYGSYGSYGSTGSYGSMGSMGSYGSHGGAVIASCGSSGGTVTYSKGAVQHGGVIQKGGASQKGGMIEGGDMTVPAPAPVDSASKARQAVLTVSVPTEARVYVNGTLTKSTGAMRNYVSRGLKPGYRYSYEVRAELTRDGETVEETKVVQLQAGGNSELAFGFDAEPAETTLTLHVPEDAKITLSGTEISGEGPVRVFTTKRLSSDQQWTDYEVEVKVTRDGQELTRSRMITLTAGEKHDVSFDFDAPRVASIN